MGLINSKEYENKAIINCDDEQNIISCNQNTLILLNYSLNDLIGKHITILMSSLLTLVHKKMFKMIKERDNNQIDKLKPKIRNHKNNLRHFYIYDSLQHPILCSVDVKINKDLTTTVILEKIEQYLSPLVPQKYLKFINSDSSFNIDEYNNVICIMMDIANSTEICNQLTPSGIALIYHNIYKIASIDISTLYYPYAYIHETCGDSLFIIVNAEYIKKFDILAATIALKIASEIQEKIDKYLESYTNFNLYLRCGISMGNIAGGVIDGKTFRVFGSTVHLANRLENKCEKSEFLIDTNMKKKIEKEINIHSNQYLNECIKEDTKELKGFGLVQTFSVNRNKIINIINENI